MPVYRPLPTVLTAPLPEPLPPPRRCRQSDGSAAVCVLDALAWIGDLRALLQQANQDRARAALLGGADGAQ